MKIKDIVLKTIFVLSPVPTRGFMKYVKANYRNSIGAEIGIAGGLHAYKYLSTIKDIELVYLIDPYAPYEMDGEMKDYSYLKDEAMKRLSPFNKKIAYTFLSSKEASERLDILFDWVYIDANHDFNHTLQDINLWYPKIKKGGVIGGHDFSGSFSGVAKAVLEFAEKNKKKVFGSGSDWIIKK